VYQLDLGPVTAVTQLLGLGGAYHAGVEVYGVEWAFGGCDTPGTGVYHTLPAQSRIGEYKEKVSLGETEMSPDQVKGALQVLQKEWGGRGYHLTARNCVHFCDAFADALGVVRAPGWVNELANLASTLIGAQLEGVTVAAEDDSKSDADKVRMLEAGYRQMQSNGGRPACSCWSMFGLFRRRGARAPGADTGRV
jgi:hypothetical protein